MSAIAGELSPVSAGAEVLREVARRRATGVLAWERAAGLLQIEFAGGRAVRGAGAGLTGADARQTALLLVRAFGCGLRGAYRFIEREVTPAADSVDPLGEALVAVLTAMTEAQLDLVWKARPDVAVSRAPSFDTLQAASLQIGAPAVPVADDAVRLADLAFGAPLPLQRAIAGQLFLGGLAIRSAAGVGKRAPAGFKSSDPRTRAAVAEIDSTYELMQTQSLYETLGVPKSAGVDMVRKAYLEAAKRWHSDRFSGMQLGDAGAKAEEIFRRIGEAQRILTDPEQRKSYDFVLERQAQGLPTDPAVILEAEGLFKKAQSLVRRGQGAQALPLLERAVELNKGEAEFWVYLGFALYSAKGTETRQQAERHIKHGLEMREKMDVAFEFLGRIARVENSFEEAKKQFKKALDINPKNVEVERELRLIAMRAGKGGGGPGGGLLDKLRGKK
jgi:curved DNA-binding protein CbpA